MGDALFTFTQETEFHDLLSMRRQRLAARLRSQRVVDASMIHLVGRTAERDVDRRTVEFDRKQLADIDSALKRLEAGCFGLCARCGHAIRVSRLRASPTTRFCRQCFGAGTPKQPGGLETIPPGYWGSI
jgi:RNA polymerase-binding transcription factor DksA